MTHSIQRYRLSDDLLYIALNTFIWLVLFGLCRILLILWNIELIADASVAQLLNSFVIGVRFDLRVVVLLMTPLVFSLVLPFGLKYRVIYQTWLFTAGLAMLFVAVAEVEFYREFHSRMNTIALQYLSEDVGTVSSMVLHGSPVLALSSIVTALYILLVFSSNNVNRRTQTPASPDSISGNYRWRVPVFFLVFLVFIIAGRGTLRQGPPLRWGDAYQSNHLFVNHLGLNGVFTLGHAVTGWGKSKSADQWKKFSPLDSAKKQVRKMLDMPGDQWIDESISTVYRRSLPTALVNELSRVPGLKGITNITIIMMESFSGYFVGALGSDANITPHFDKLAQQGLLFSRFFSNGTHTHQGMFATFACFPNLPDYEYLMQQPEGDTNFSGFPAVMNELGYENDAYVYNGDFSWDNQQGFFRKQGLSHFVGRNDYIDPIYSDPTWGVSDEDMFNRAIPELDQLHESGRFFAMLQTLSNHLPYALPTPLPVEPVSGHGSLDLHLTAMRYSDWALGQFFEQAKSKPWYPNTLFVVVGDHGFGVPQQVTDIDLLRFRVPALFIAPGIQQAFGASNDTAASQVDLVPTAAALLGQPYNHACWGRNILALEPEDPGFAVIKPSGSDKTVAMVSGDRILVKAPDQAPKLSHYQLGSNSKGISPGSKLLDDSERTEMLHQQLGSYIQTAVDAIIERKAGHY